MYIHVDGFRLLHACTYTHTKSASTHSTVTLSHICTQASLTLFFSSFFLFFSFFNLFFFFISFLFSNLSLFQADEHALRLTCFHYLKQSQAAKALSMLSFGSHSVILKQQRGGGGGGLGRWGECSELGNLILTLSVGFII